MNSCRPSGFENIIVHYLFGFINQSDFITSSFMSFSKYEHELRTCLSQQDVLTPEGSS